MRRKHQGKRAGSVFAAFVLALSSPLTASAASPQFAYDEATWARLQDNVMEYDELELLVQEYNPTYLNNQATYQDGRESRNASEVREKQYEGAYDIYDSAENLRDQADDLEDLLSVPGMASAYASLMSAAVLTETTALQTEQSADASYRDSEMDRLDYMRQQDAVIAQVQSLFASYNQVKKTEPLLEKSLELQELSHQATEASRALGLATQIDVLQSLQSLESLRERDGDAGQPAVFKAAALRDDRLGLQCQSGDRGSAAGRREPHCADEPGGGHADGAGGKPGAEIQSEGL